MYTSRSKVYGAIDTERDYQDRQWDHSLKPLSLGEELLLIEEYAARCRMEWTNAPGVAPPAALHGMRKIAGIAVRCLEVHGAPPRI